MIVIDRGPDFIAMKGLQSCSMAMWGCSLHTGRINEEIYGDS